MARRKKGRSKRTFVDNQLDTLIHEFGKKAEVFATLYQRMDEGKKGEMVYSIWVGDLLKDMLFLRLNIAAHKDAQRSLDIEAGGPVT